jgi:DUF4097 and DUF4098 domain-containing protein YvlB
MMNKLNTNFAHAIVLLSFLSAQLFANGLDLLHDKKFEVREGELLELEISTGDIIIDSWNENTVSIKIFGNSKAENKLEFTFEKTGKGVLVKAEKKGSSWFKWFSSIKLRAEVKVPKTFSIESKTSGGNVKLSNVEGRLALKTSGGDIFIENSSGELTAKTSGGNVASKNHSGPATLSTSGGDIETFNLEGDIDASTSGGNLNLNVNNGKVDAGTSGGDVELNYSGENMGVQLSTSGGNIIVKLPIEFSANVYCKTSGGDVEIEFPAQSSSKIKSGRFEGTFNGGGPELECKTSGGDITVKPL